MVIYLMKHFPLLLEKFPGIQEETLLSIFSMYTKNISPSPALPQTDTLSSEITSQKEQDFEAWFLQTFTTELDVVDWLLDIDDIEILHPSE